MFSRNSFINGGPCHIEISPFIYRASQWTGFYVIGIFIMKEFILFTIEDTGKALENIYSLFANTCIILDSIEYLQIYFFLAA